MRSILSVLLLCAVALGGTAGATATPPSVAAHYDAVGPDGILTVFGLDGTPVCAVDSFGIPVAFGLVQGGVLQAYAPNSGPGASGAIMTVFAGEHVLAVGYDDWWFD